MDRKTEKQGFRREAGRTAPREIRQRRERHLDVVAAAWENDGETPAERLVWDRLCD